MALPSNQIGKRIFYFGGFATVVGAIVTIVALVDGKFETWHVIILSGGLTGMVIGHFSRVFGTVLMVIGALSLVWGFFGIIGPDVDGVLHRIYLNLWSSQISSASDHAKYWPFFAAGGAVLAMIFGYYLSLSQADLEEEQAKTAASEARHRAVSGVRCGNCDWKGKLAQWENTGMCPRCNHGYYKQDWGQYL